MKRITLLATLILSLAMSDPAFVASAATPSVLFTGQSPYILATSNDQAPFSVSVSASGASNNATISTVLYPRLSTRSGLMAALSGQDLGSPVDQTAPLRLSCLPVAAKGGQQLTIDVVTSPATPRTIAGGCSGSTTPPSFDLHCTVGSGSCNGVYPLVVSVADGSAQLARFVTLMTYIERPAAAPLKLAMVFDLGGSPASSTPAILDAVSHALKHAPTIAQDVIVQPTMLQALDSTSQGQASIAQLAQEVNASPSTHELLTSPYVPIDPGTLAVSGLGADVAMQLKRGNEITSAASLPAPSTTGGWVATSSVTSSSLDALAANGIGRVVIPDASLAQPTSQSTSWGEPFVASPGPSSIEALASDATLSAQLVSGAQPALTAARFLGDLSFLHFERPSLSTPLGVVANSGLGYVANETFLDAVFEGLQQNPIVTSSTLSGLFNSLTPGANGVEKSRTLATTSPATPWPVSQVSGLTVDNQRQAAFASAVVGGASTLTTLSDNTLKVEDDRLTTMSRPLALIAATNALSSQLAKIQISSDAITMTSLNGTLPITITSTADYTVNGIFQVSSTQLRFPKGAQSSQSIDRSTRSVRISAQAETSGDFPLTATLVTPEGGLVIANQKITVRATQSSIVGVILTVGALAVLGLWWFQTWRRSRKKRAARQ